MTEECNKNAVMELYNRGYQSRHIAIVMGCKKSTLFNVTRVKQITEPTLKFLNKQQKQRLFVLDKLLELKLVSTKWCSNDYYYITILRFLHIPKDTIRNMYKSAPQVPLARALREKSPYLGQFDYTVLGINSEEWFEFVAASYKVMRDSDRWR